jgi:hypothetical protein
MPRGACAGQRAAGKRGSGWGKGFPEVEGPVRRPDVQSHRTNRILWSAAVCCRCSRACGSGPSPTQPACVTENSGSKLPHSTGRRVTTERICANVHEVASSAGFEPATFRLGGERSIQLSYEDMAGHSTAGGALWVRPGVGRFFPGDAGKSRNSVRAQRGPTRACGSGPRAYNILSIAAGRRSHKSEFAIRPA